MQKDHSDYFIERVLSKNTTHPGSPLKPELLKFKDGSEIVNMGLTKREYFAAMAMQGICANSSLAERSSYNSFAEWSVQQADALIEALNK
jgi:hypothetical protein